MLEKRILDKLLGAIKRGAVKIVYWDGDTKTYGTGKPYFTLTIHHPRAVRRVARNLTLGFGESYANGDIDIDGPLDHIGRLASENPLGGRGLYRKLSYRRKRNNRRSQKGFIQHHYDLGNDFYKLWLDKSLTYSCAYFEKPSDKLERAQTAKVDHVLRKLRLSKGQHLLDIGCGWGTLLFKAAETYGVTGLGITLSREQYEHCVTEAKRRKLSGRLKFKLLNYQDLAKQNQRFDRIVSVGMYEHVGRKNQAAYFGAIDRLLKPGGISVLHTISQPTDLPNDAWIDKYIFPGGHLPTVASIVEQLPKNHFRLLDYESLKLHYALTLDEWLRRYEKHQKQVTKMYGEQFYRMWRLWLASSSAGFRYGDLDLSQFIFVKQGGQVTDIPLTRRYLYK